VLPVVMALGMGAIVPSASAANTCVVGKSTIAQCFPDPNLAQKVADQADASPYSTFTSGMAYGITTLDADDKALDANGDDYMPIVSIAGIGNLPNLSELSLNSNHISDLSPLEGLNNLQTLYIKFNRVPDLSPLRNLTTLQSLDARGNPVSDLTPLKQLYNLQSLMVSGQISDISALKRLTNLGWLEVHSDNVSDLSPLKGMTNLICLKVNGRVSDLSPLDNLTNLTYLDLDSNHVSDVGPLDNLTNLTGLELGGNRVSDVSPLAKLTKLTDLYLDGNQISDVGPLTKLTNLTMLGLGSQSVSLPVASSSSVSVSTARSVDGSFVQPDKLSPSSGSYDVKTGTVSWKGLSGSGSVSLHASTTGTIGAATYGFDVTITQPYTPPKPPVVKYAVSFDAQGGSAVVSQSVVKGGKAVKPANPSRSGYTFAGWSSDKAGTKPYDFNTAVTANLALYAQWKAAAKPKPVPSVAISFDANGGKFANGSGTQKASVKQGAKYALAKAPSRSGYSFLGWFTAKNGGSKVTGTPVAAGSRTLYAQWAAAKLSPKPSLGMPVAVYRVYNTNSGLHHYTTSAKERDALVKLGWRSEGTSFQAAKPGSANGLKPVYREYNPHDGNHNWTLDPSEHKTLVKLGWKDEGVAWYTNPSGPVTVYRLYNPHSGEHVYTTSAKEYAAVGKAGWHQEGTAWRGL
jgi:uncharacterized repeat protein (TIGR02543 family)